MTLELYRQVRELIVAALKHADFFGAYRRCEWNLKPIAECIIQYYTLRPERIFYAFENAHIAKLASVYAWFTDVPVLFVSGKAEQQRALQERQYGWSGIVGTVCHWGRAALDDRGRAMDRFDYRVALVGGGVDGKILTADAKAAGGVGIDFGNGIGRVIQLDAEGIDAWDWPKFPKYGSDTGKEQAAHPPC